MVLTNDLASARTWTFDNYRVKVYETFLKPGCKLPFHSHVAHLRFCFSAGVNKHTWADGTVETIVDDAGDYEWRDSLDHSVENTGDIEIHSLIVEPKDVTLKLQVQIPDFDGFFNQANARGNNKLITDNQRIRAFELSLAENESFDAIAHAPTMYFVYSGTVRFVLSHESLVSTTLEIPSHTGQYFEASVHTIQATEPTKILVVELK